ncbi:MAG: carbohydrate ABC transporter permease [Chloroflexi bacterium]|nr:carbohydrate ABC transporter permease [Chloroflexota bacterium]
MNMETDLSVFVEREIGRSKRFGRRSSPKQIALFVAALCLSLIFFFPLFYTISSSLKEAWEIFVYPPTLLPAAPRPANYVRLFEVVPFGTWLKNTVNVVILSTLGAVISSSFAAYSFARFKYRGRDFLFVLTLATMMLPAQVTLIPQFILFHKMGWINTIKPLWVPAWFGGGAFNIFLMRQFFLSLPLELDEAALIDGASRFRIFSSILIPLCKPVIATMAVISFMGNWSDFMGPLIYLNSPAKFTLAIGLNYLKAVPEVQIGERLETILMAACVLNIIPCVIIFFSAQRYFVRGIVTTGLKG